MGFISPRMPDFDLDEWRAQPHHRRIEPLARDWALNGFGTPEAIYLLYLVKLLVFVGGAILVVAATSDVGGITDVDRWWTTPIAYQKFVVWTLLWEILGLGCGSMPLTFRFLPPVGGFLYWLRPGTMRLPPWPGRIPPTAGTRRTPVDVALYLAVLVVGVGLLFSGSSAGFATLPAAGIAGLLVCLVALGLRDKAPSLAARPEHYAVMLLIFLFPPENMIFALKLVMIAMWWGAATSKLNKHFPFVVSVMISNTPWQRSKWVKRRLWRDYPTDLRPGSLARMAAHGGTVVEYTVPLVLLLSRGGLVSTVAVTVMVLFHVHITSTFPLGVPLEWNLFFIFSTLYLFGHYAAVGPGSFASPVLGLLLLGLLVGLPALGNLKPEAVSFLPSMRYYAGNWATSVWLFRNDGAEEILDRSLVKPAPVVVKQLTKLYDAETAELLLYKGLAFRAMHSHGRALGGLMTRAVDDLTGYTPREGELVAGVALGWNFGEGHLHNAQLLAAVQELCHFAPGQLRVITLESQPIHQPEQRYQILDAADGLLEEGLVQVDDMIERQPWLGADDVTIPVEVTFSASGELGFSTPNAFADILALDESPRPRPRPRPSPRSQQARPT
ncbi:MAG TPA: DUF3556 domain-containing protein [Jatrophihabitans sp.]|jgi:hypothetical protein|uniref:DUF3556 domain-containing protein n=1 Tax=Jatrophihabitans sp. TaxID=1932789 RepID=UPI002E0A7093|nr:DUF3556 domain-containing protein [Jatrophihabitans sp.]